MNHLLAKTKGRRGVYYKVISDEPIFELPDDLDDPKQYDANYKLEEDEWFAIPEFSTKDYFIDFLRVRFVSAEYDQIPRDAYRNIDFLCAYQTGIYYFQKLSTSQIVRKKYFACTDEPVLVTNEPIIVIDNFPDAVYIKREDVLYFKDLGAISGIFKGIEELYKEATQEETDEFLGNDFIHLANGYSAAKVKKANRKRIAMAMETLQRFTEVEKVDIFGYIREYCGDLPFNEHDANFSISSEAELKKLLYGIEQRYYTTRLGGERRLANSIIAL